MRWIAVLALGLAVLAGPARAEGDAKEGEKVFLKCRACHSAEPGKNSVGPSLAGIVGRKAGTVPGFTYSRAMIEKDMTWDEKNLAAYVADPRGFIPGNKMVFIGLKKQSEIEHLIAYLKTRK